MDKAKRRRLAVSAVEQIIVGLFLVGGYVMLAVVGELLCRLFGVGA